MHYECPCGNVYEDGLGPDDCPKCFGEQGPAILVDGEIEEEDE